MSVFSEIISRGPVYIFTVVLLFLYSCQNTRPYVDESFKNWETEIANPDTLPIRHRLILIGDAGNLKSYPEDPVLGVLEQLIGKSEENITLAFLGDNLYPKGLTGANSEDSLYYRSKFLRYHEYLHDYAARVLFIPGNHDWANAGKDGLQAVKRQQQLVDSLFGEDSFQPKFGLPGPKTLKISSDTRLMILDTQWWLHKYHRATGNIQDEEIENDGDFITEIENSIAKYADDNLVVLGHHPVVSVGPHGGNYGLRTHLFPLTELKSWAFVPLPGLGSLYPLWVKYFGSRQDLAHFRYKSFRKSLISRFHGHENLIYVSGHDHSLQYFSLTDEFGYEFSQIISGSGSKRSFAAKGKEAHFAQSQFGLVEIAELRDARLIMRVWSLGRSGSFKEVFRKQLSAGTGKIIATKPEFKGEIAFQDSVKTLVLNPNYEAGKFVTRLMGEGNRELWTTPVTLPYLDIGLIDGGLSPVKRGGGLQTTNIRLENPEGRQYALRTVDKDASRSLPDAYQQTVARDVLQDQVSTLNPFGALIVPALSEAVNVFHTDPKLYFVPNDPRFGVYKPFVANKVMLLEKRAGDEWIGSGWFDDAEEIRSPSTLYEKIDGDNDFEVDQFNYARARFLDLLIGDWDRHINQWHWAEFDKKGKGKIYRPVPRDRDFAFFRFEGPVPDFVRLLESKYQSFGEEYGNVKGMTKNGLSQDRRLMNELSKSDWQAIADSMRNELTDEVIEKAVSALPPEIFELQGQRLIHELKTRRDRLTVTALELYKWNNRVVDIAGSNKHEYFEINGNEDGFVEVRVWKTSKEGEKREVIYLREFNPVETEEIRIFGLSGNDHFHMEGTFKKAPMIRIVGGNGTDTVDDAITKRSAFRHLLYYDTYDGTYWSNAKNVSLRLSDDPTINDRNTNGYRHNANLFMPFFAYNPDDGFFVGGGLRFIRHGFRHEPYRSVHRIKGNLAFNTLGYNLVYEGHYTGVLGKNDFFLDASWLSPTNILNFYGFGNETRQLEDAAFYQAQLQQLMISPSAYSDNINGSFFKLGPTFEVIRVRENRLFDPDSPNIFIEDQDRFNIFDTQTFGGVQFMSLLHNLSNPLNPKQGFRWINIYDYNRSLQNEETNYFRLYTDLAIYYSPFLSPQLTWANRFGASHNFGDFPFYHANTLGGNNSLRGFRTNRFTGRSSAFYNTELRLRISRISSYLLVGDVGMTAFFDTGRVWDYKNDNSGIWHQGYGAGLWINLFNFIIINNQFGFSEEGSFYFLRAGFQF